MKRSDRLVGLTNFFVNNPQKLVQLSYFTERYNASKSSISEDLDIINEMLKYEGIGSLERFPGAAGGAKYIPNFTNENSIQFIQSLCEKLEDPSRILPGGYLYMSDLLGDPSIVRQIGKVFVSAFFKKEIDAVVTVETKGIPLAYAVADYLNVPVVVIRRNMRVTEGSSVSINYVSGRSQRIQTMVLPKRNLQEGMNVCIIDDFMKAGGTVTGMISLLEEFKATVVGIGVFAEAEDNNNERMIEQYTSLIKVSNLQNKDINVKYGSILQK
ncbi:pur operon repressor [Pseudogracilibacillus auburnensis]|uniref:Purine operon repressor PurR n=1 Tax=Pseudogracilibacillus auburnensis TaxID=1494959 RepID=A0A2V3VNE9_9BACI|nr:pur operon repressor [Pseudogracilibacillus auburnensis]PXW81545.1 purine operon repressor PurR [Pseudogracilibacillus auburnensis]